MRFTNLSQSEFFNRYNTEDNCLNDFVQKRLNDGIVCKGCNCITKHYYIKSVKQFRCSKCRKHQGLRVGTYMEHSNLPFRYWYFVSFMMTSFTKSFSAREMQRQLQHNRYEPIYWMMHKIRVTMGNRDKLYFLQGQLEGDEGFTTTYLTTSQKAELPKPLAIIQKNQQGRGSERKTPILVVAESVYTKNDHKHKPNKAVGFVRMSSLTGTKSNELNFELSKMIKKDGSMLVTDANPSYNKSTKVVSIHKQVNTNVALKEDVIKEHLPWVHTIISNFKRNVLNAHHAISSKYLDNYLAEFQYKFNRRNFKTDCFDHIIRAGLSMNWYQDVA